MHIGRCKLMYCPIHGPIVRCQQTKGLRFECHGTTLFDRCNGDGGTVGKHARVAAAVTPRNARLFVELRAPAARLERYHLFCRFNSANGHSREAYQQILPGQV
jgi:hypothetical protein